MGDLSAFHEGDSRIGAAAAQQTGQAQAGDEDKTPQGFRTFSECHHYVFTSCNYSL